MTRDQYQEDLANSSMCNVLSLDALFEEREQNGGAELPDGTLDSGRRTPCSGRSCWRH